MSIKCNLLKIKNKHLGTKLQILQLVLLFKTHTQNKFISQLKENFRTLERMKL